MVQPLISYYEALEQASEQMLAAARAGQWDDVVRLESACAVLIAQLRQASLEHNLTPEHQRNKRQIMQRILRNDAQVRQLAEPWIEDIDFMLRRQQQGFLH